MLLPMKHSRYLTNLKIKIMKKLTILLIAFAFSFITACGQNQNGSNGLTNQSKKITYKIDSSADLLNALPSKTVAYARVPSLVSLLTTPQGDALYPVTSSEVSQSQSASILEGIDKNLLSKIDQTEVRELARLFMKKQTSPLEMAVVAASSLTPELLIQTKVGLNSIDELTALLMQIVVASENHLQLSEEPDAEGNFSIAVGPYNAFGYFDLKSKDFVIYGGPTARKSNLTQYRKGEHEKREDLAKFEAQFDASGAGLAMWLDTSTLWSQFSPMAPAHIKAQLDLLNLKNTQFLYLGTGSKNGHSSMRLHIDYKESDENLFHFPVSLSTLDVPIAMPLNFTAAMPLPSQQHLEQIMKLEEGFGESPSIRSKLAKITEKFKTEYQLDFNQLLSAFGDNVRVVNDKAGTWAAVPIQNNEGFDKLIDATTQKLGATHKKTSVSGLEINHYIFPGLTKMAIDLSGDKDIKSQAPEVLMQLLSGENLHFYWVREGDNLIMASLPQTLLSRERHKSNVTVGQWAQSQELNRGDSIFSITSNAKDLPKTAYHMYLSMIQSLSDIAGVEANLTAMPLAEDLGLAEVGRVGLALNTSKTSTSLVFDYEHTPLDYLSGGNAMATVAVVGILAAVALPAYQDYTIRAKAAEALLLASNVKITLSEYYSENGKYPSFEDSKDFATENYFANVYFDSKEEHIKIIFAPGIDDRLTDTELNLIPVVIEGNYIEWDCSNVSAPIALIPVSCR